VTNADAIREELLSVVNQGTLLLVADMSKTTFCDSAGVSALVRTFTRASASASGMRLVVKTPAVRRILSLTGVDRLIYVYPSVAASLGLRPGHNDRPHSDDATAKVDTDLPIFLCKSRVAQRTFSGRCSDCLHQRLVKAQKACTRVPVLHNARSLGGWI
jgi:anti-sigma B factor antagonist